MRNRNTIEFLGLRERLNNVSFKPLEFEGFKTRAGLNSFVLTPRQWIDTTHASGLVSKAVRSFHVPNVTGKTLGSILEKHVDKSAELMTDDAVVYDRLGKSFARHGVVNHSIHEYARGDITTNSAEGYFSLLKRGLNGIYHNVSEHHLHRYLAEFDFRYTNRTLSNGQRTALAIKQADGKRLMYRCPNEISTH